MSEKADAIARIRSAFKELHLAENGLSDENMHEVSFGEWSAKDLLAHMASWDEFGAAHINGLGRGHIPCLASFRPAEIDEWNKFFMKTRLRWPLVQVRFESQHSHDGLVDALNLLPESMFAVGHMVVSLCGITSQHYEEHTAQIRRRFHRLTFGQGSET